MIINKKLLLIILGSSLEYYDFVLYGLLANYISKAFFPITNSTTQLIQSFSIFTLGYLIRPISGTILGIIADKYSNIRVFSFSILLMGIATLSIGLIPSYSAVGIISVFLLAASRMIQGISFASELPGAITILGNSYFSTHVPISSSIGYLMASTSFGSIAASLIVYLLHIILTERQILDWGWRLPFILGGILAAISYYIRRSLENSEELKSPSHRKAKESTISFLFNIFICDYKLIAQGIGITSLIAAGTIFLFYLPHYLELHFVFDTTEIKLYSFIGMLTFAVFSILFGSFLERINFQKFFIKVAAAFPILIYLLILEAKLIGGSLSLFIFFFFYEICMAALFISGLRILSQLFSHSHRTTSISLCYNLSFSIFSLSPIFINYLILITNMVESACIFFLILSTASVSILITNLDRRLHI